MVTISRGIVAWAGGGDALCETGFVLQQCNKRVVFGIGWFCGRRLWWLLYGGRTHCRLCVFGCPNRLSGTVDLVAVKLFDIFRGPMVKFPQDFVIL